MRFVEETGGLWTAEQLRAAEAEIEQQKREWEANRLAALKKEEEDEKRAAEEDEMLTYSREDAQNQVNNNKFNRRKPVNRKLLKLKQNNRNNVSNSKRIKVRQQQQQQHIEKPVRMVAQRALGMRRALRNNSKPISSLAKTGPVNIVRKVTEPTTKSHVVKSVALATKRVASLRASSRLNRSAKRLRRNTKNGTSDEDNNDNDVDSVVDTTKDNNGIAETNTKSTAIENSKVTGISECSDRPRSEDFDDSECSLDVMIDSTDPQETDETSNGDNNDEDDEYNENDEDDEDVDFDDNDEESNESTLVQSDESVASFNDTDSDYAKTNSTLLNSTLKNSSITDNHINVNSPRTRSHGRVKIDLWTLDKNQKVPELCAKRSLNRSNGPKNNSNIVNASATDNEHCENGNDSANESDGSEKVAQQREIDHSDIPKQNTSASETKSMRQSKISDCFSRSSRLSGATTPSNNQSNSIDSVGRTRKSFPANTSKTIEKSEPTKKPVVSNIKSRASYEMFIASRSPKVVLNKDECEQQQQKSRMKNKS